MSAILCKSRLNGTSEGGGASTVAKLYLGSTGSTERVVRKRFARGTDSDKREMKVVLNMNRLEKEKKNSKYRKDINRKYVFELTFNVMISQSQCWMISLFSM